MVIGGWQAWRAVPWGQTMPMSEGHMMHRKSTVERGGWCNHFEMLRRGCGDGRGSWMVCRGRAGRLQTPVGSDMADLWVFGGQR